MKNRIYRACISAVIYGFVLCLFIAYPLSALADEEVSSTEATAAQEEPEEQIILEQEADPEEKLKENGWYKVKKGDSSYYKYKAEGEKDFAVGKKKIGKNYYYFDENGQLVIGRWLMKDNKKHYYCDKEGRLAKGWKKISGYHYYFDKSNALVQDLIKHFGEQWYNEQNIYIRVNKYHNCVTIYAKTADNEYNMPVKSFPCTAGYATILINTTLKKGNTYRWHELMGPTFGQFCTRIHKGFLFHSVLYTRPNKYALNVRQYNKLGTTASHGCVRLAVIDAKRIYDDVNRLKEVGLTIYSDSKSVGPFDKPEYPKVKWGQKFDPTDPTV